MNFNLMKKILFPIFHVHKIQKQIILNLFSKEANFRVLHAPTPMKEDPPAPKDNGNDKKRKEKGIGK